METVAQAVNLMIFYFFRPRECRPKNFWETQLVWATREIWARFCLTPIVNIWTT